MENKIITLLCPIKAAPGRGAQLAVALKALADMTAKEPGNVCYVPHATENPDLFIVYEQWKGDEAMDFHMNTRHLTEFLADEAGLLAEEPHGQPLRVL